MKKIIMNKYEIIESIAEGGMGKVSKAMDLHLNRIVAVKETKVAGNRMQKETVRKEMELLKTLEHPRLPRILDYWEEQDTACVIMDYVEGVTLEKYLHNRGRAEPDKAVKWAIELADVLSYLHGNQIIYRDLKPANIMVKPDGEIKLIDLGAAAIINAVRESSSVRMGTLAYSAPELWKGGNAGCEADIYGLGAVLHEMLTGVRPDKPPYLRLPIRAYDKTLPLKLDKIICTCTSENPEYRYQSAEQLTKELQSYSTPFRIREFLRKLQKLTGVLLWCMTAASLMVPLLKGVPENMIPVPLLYKPISLMAMSLIFTLSGINRAKEKYSYLKQEKSSRLTEKPFTGLYSFFGAVFIGVNFIIAALFQPAAISAQEAQAELWVDMRDENGRKLLLKNDSVYDTDQKIHLEIPVDKMPDEKIALQLIASGESGKVYISRIFLLKANYGKID